MEEDNIIELKNKFLFDLKELRTSIYGRLGNPSAWKKEELLKFRKLGIKLYEVEDLLEKLT